MHDLFPIPAPAWLQQLTAPLARASSLPTLPLHIHEVILAFTFYQLLFTTISPWISARLFPAIYPQFNKRTRLNWDVHVVSLTQSLVVNSLALYLIFYDEERADMNWAGRIWGYDGASGLLQGLAAGYFLWDLMITTRYLSIFGVGMLLHAMSAVTVFSFGFRPFLNYYGPVFILYELSSPALNIHWFMDKLHLTGSIYQLINGVVLITTFFSCRLVWGSINSVFVFRDIWKAMNEGHIIGDDYAGLKHGLAQSQQPPVAGSSPPAYDIMQYAGDRNLPAWLALSYLASNIVLNMLNYYWFGKMIETLRKRFDPPLGTKGLDEKKEKHENIHAGVTDEPKDHDAEIEIRKGVYGDSGRKTLEIQGRELRSRRKA